MTTRIHENLLKGIFFLVLFIVLMLHTVMSQAQSFRNQSPKLYKGFVVSFGTRASTLSSNITKIDQSGMLQAGGQVGLLVGNDVVRAKLGLLGYYSSTEIAAGTSDLYTSNAVLNFYPLACLSGSSFIIEPYITGSLDYDQTKFFGHYVNHEAAEMNYSQATAPYLGKIKQVNATIGLGVEVKLTDTYDFIHLFSEVRYGHNISTKSTNAAFSGTTIQDQTSITLGVSFGMHR